MWCLIVHIYYNNITQKLDQLLHACLGVLFVGDAYSEAVWVDDGYHPRGGECGQQSVHGYSYICHSIQGEIWFTNHHVGKKEYSFFFFFKFHNFNKPVFFSLVLNLFVTVMSIFNGMILFLISCFYLFLVHLWETFPESGREKFIHWSKCCYPFWSTQLPGFLEISQKWTS